VGLSFGDTLLRFFGVLLLLSSSVFLFAPIWGDTEDSEPYSVYEGHSLCNDSLVYLIAQEECESISEWFVYGLGGAIIGLVLTLIPGKTVVNNYIQEQKTHPVAKSQQIQHMEPEKNITNFCPQCGTKQQISGMFCPECGEDLRI
jgi:hypothetical protein